MKLFTLASVVLLTATTATHCLSKDSIDESRKASPDGRIEIENLFGTVVVEGWDKNEVSVTGTLADDAEDFDLSGSDRRTLVEVVFPRRSRNLRDTDSDLKVMVPQGSQVLVSGVNLDIEVSKVNGEVRLETVNGELSVSGSPEAIQAESVNGDVLIDAKCDDIRAESVSGGVTLTQASGQVEVSTVTGRIEVVGEEFEDVDLSSVSGSIRLEGAPTFDGDLEFESHSGSILLRVPEELSAEFEVTTFSGRIKNEFGPRPEKTSKYTPGQELEFTVGEGDASFSVSSFSGTVQIEYK